MFGLFPSELFELLKGIFIIYFVIRILVFLNQLIYYSHWNILLDVQFSTNEFFEKIKEGLNNSEVKGINFGTDNLRQSVTSLTRRTYLTITYQDYVFYVSGAPFGKYFFVSYWGHIKSKPLYAIIKAIPIIGNTLATMMASRTYYEYDQCSSFMRLLHEQITTIIVSLTKEQGKAMPELPKPTMSDVFKR